MPQLKINHRTLMEAAANNCITPRLTSRLRSNYECAFWIGFPCKGSRIWAQVAELVDALASGASFRKEVEVRVFSWAPNTSLKYMKPLKNLSFH